MQDDSHAIKLDAIGTVSIDCLCKRCAYNLRGLPESGRCPECGTPVAMSIAGDLLCTADPQWVEKVALGLKIILWMILLSVLAGILNIGIAMVVPGLEPLLTLAAACIGYYGVWLLTEPDPGQIGEGTNWTARRVVRVTLVFGIAGEILMFMGENVTLGTASSVALVLCGVLFMIISIPGEFAKFLYYEWLARRIPDEALADRARLIRWGYTIALGVMVLAGIPAILTAWKLQKSNTAGAGMSAELGAVMCVIGVAGIALLIFGLMTLFLLIRLRRAVAQQARLARETWAANST